jgi:cytochrome b subunit of formate dehydrogenase
MRASQLVLLVVVVLPAGMLLAYFDFVVAGKVRGVELPKDHTRSRHLWLLVLLHIFWIGMLVSVWRDA